MNYSLENIFLANSMWNPQRILIYGPQGLGKSTFATTFPCPILVRAEDGACALPVPTLPILKSFDDLSAIIDMLHQPGHGFETLIIDTVDWLEPLVWAHLLKERDENDKGVAVTSIEDYGFGKGYAFADEWWRYLLGGFDSLRDQMRMNIVLIAHSEIKQYSPPESEPYDRYQIKIHRRAAELLTEWADMVLFCQHQTKIKKDDLGFKRTASRGTGSGDRMIFTDERPAFRAKNRWSLPPEIFIGQDKTWSAFHKALNKATDGQYPLKHEKVEQ